MCVCVGWGGGGIRNEGPQILLAQAPLKSQIRPCLCACVCACVRACVCLKMTYHTGTDY